MFYRLSFLNQKLSSINAIISILHAVFQNCSSIFIFKTTLGFLSVPFFYSTDPFQDGLRDAWHRSSFTEVLADKLREYGQPSAVGACRGCLSCREPALLPRSLLSQSYSHLVFERGGDIKAPPRPFQPKVGQFCPHMPLRSQGSPLRLWIESPLCVLRDRIKIVASFILSFLCFD